MSTDVFASLAGAVVGAMLGWLGALIQTGAAQDRERLIRYRGIANAVLLDVRRIEQEMGFRDSRGIGLLIAGVVTIPPTFSGPVTTLVPEIVSADPEILYRFLVVERLLENYKHFDAAEARLHDAADAQDVAVRTYPRPSANVSHDQFDADMQSERLRREGERLRKRADHIGESQDRARPALFDAIERLAERLEPLAHLEIPDLVSLAFERSVPEIPELAAPKWKRYVGRRLLPREVADVS